MSQRDSDAIANLVSGGPYGNAGQRPRTRRQFKEIGFETLKVYAGAGGDTDPGKFQFTIRTPSSQVRTRVAVNFECGAGAPAYPDITAAGNTIWVAASDDPRGGASSRDIPNSSVEGMRSAPTPFPSTVVAGVVTLDPGLTGYSREFVSASEYLVGEIAIPPNGFAGAWVLVVTVQANDVVLPEDEWQEIVSGYSLLTGKAPA